jgi:hypothetical protein
MGPDNITKLDELVETIKSDWEKFDGGNKSAGTRVRKACQELKKLAQDIRIDVQNIKNG